MPDQDARAMTVPSGRAFAELRRCVFVHGERVRPTDPRALNAFEKAAIDAHNALVGLRAALTKYVSFD
jgi:hypothetical protein